MARDAQPDSARRVAELVWPDAGHVPAQVVAALEDSLVEARAVYVVAGAHETARFLAATAVAAMDGGRTRYTVVSRAAGFRVAVGPFATWRSAAKLIAQGDAGHPALLLPLVPAPVAGRPRYLA